MADAIERFLQTGEHDPRFPDWDGPLATRRTKGSAELKDVLVKVTRWRTNRAPISLGRVPDDAAARIRSRVTPLLEGLFPARDAVRLIERLPDHVVILMPSTFAAEVQHLSLRTAWDLANVLLDQVGAPPLGDDAPTLDGLCDDTGRAWILPQALTNEADFPDVVVHEAAHLLHTLSAADLLGRRRTGPILRVPVRQRETFAYACELWSCAMRAGPEDIGDRLRTWRKDMTDARIQVRKLDLVLENASQRPRSGWAVIRRWARTMEG